MFSSGILSVSVHVGAAMVLWQIHTLDHLDTSGFGRPFPRHGLQLLFWFSNHCVTFEPDNSGDVMKVGEALRSAAILLTKRRVNLSLRFSAGVGVSAGERGLRIPQVWEHGGTSACSPQTQEEQEQQAGQQRSELLHP